MTSKSIIGATALFLLACGCGDSREQPESPGTDPNAQAAADVLAALLDSNDTRRIACSNISLAVSNLDDTQAVEINSALLGALEDLPPEVGAIFEIELAATPEALRVKFGSNLTVQACNDAVDPNRQPVVEAEFLPIAGTIRVEIIEHLAAFPSYKASVSLQGVRFTEDAAGVSLELGTETFGWLPG